MPKRTSKKLGKKRDLNELAAEIVEQATSEETPGGNGKNSAAVALGRLGGLKGGVARARRLSKDELSRIAKKAAAARWRKSEDS